MCKVILVSGLPVTCPDWLPDYGWQINEKGYVRYTSRRVQPLIKRGEYMQRIILRVLGGEIPEGHHAHHQDNNKLNNCPGNLVRCPCEFNPSSALRCPHTGMYMSLNEYRRVYAG